jgi:hypothetical protein
LPGQWTFGRMLRLLPLLVAAAFATGNPRRAGTTSSQNVFVDQKDPNHGALRQERFLVELSPGETMWVTEEDKLEFLRVRLDSPVRDAS